MIRKRGLFNWCIVLLWVVATHHCVFEQLIGQFHNQPFSQTTNTSSDSSLPSECPSHPAGDPASHGEGKNCGTIITQASPSSEFYVSTQAFIPILDTLVRAFIDGVDYNNSYSFGSTVSHNIISSDLSQRAYSLSIAPNAPPVTLA